MSLVDNNVTLLRSQNRTMARIEDIKIDIEALSEEEFVQFGEWFAEKDWECWDARLERDAEAGKLDSLLEEAAAAKVQGNLLNL